MQRIRAALRGRLSAVVVLWALMVAGVHAVPAPAGPGSGLRVRGVDIPPGEGSATSFRLLVHPLIAELPGRGKEVSYRGNSEVPGPHVAHGQGAWAGAPAEAERVTLAASPHRAARTSAFVVSGAERCRRFCVYRL